MWRQFLNQPMAYARPFMDFNKALTADKIRMFSDASRSDKLGFGGICEQSWVFGAWGTDLIRVCKPSIEFLELYAVVVSVRLWIHRFSNKRVILFCDNQAVVGMINTTTSSCKQCLKLIRILVLHCLTCNVRVFARYINTKANVDADMLSRLKISVFRRRNQNCDAEPTKIPKDLWPVQKIWYD